MKTLKSILGDPRLTVRRLEAATRMESAVYWMQCAQRAVDNPALNAAIHTGNRLGKPVVIFFQVLPHAHHANWRHYQFFIDGLGDIGTFGVR